MLVHGFASSYERNWREPGWADLLRDEGRQVIGVDLLGHGQAARPRDPAAYSSLEQSIITTMPGTGQVDAVGFSLGAQLLLRAAAAAPGNDRAALAACLRRPHSPLTEAEVAAVRARVLVVLGDRDFAGPADRLVAALPDVRLVALPGIDHFGTLRDFRFVQAALDFLCRDDLGKESRCSDSHGFPGRRG